MSYIMIEEQFEPTEITTQMYNNNELIIYYHQYYLYEKCLCEMMQTIKPKTEEQVLFINVIMELKEYFKTQKIKYTFYNNKKIKIKPTSKYFNKYYNDKYRCEIKELNEIYRLIYFINNTSIKASTESVDILIDLMNLQTEIKNHIKNNNEYKCFHYEVIKIKERLAVLVFNHYRFDINQGYFSYLKEQHKENENGEYDYIKDDNDFRKYKSEYYKSNDGEYVSHIQDSIEEIIYDNEEIKAIYNKTIKKQTEFKYRYIYSILNIKSYDKITKKTSNRNCNSYNTDNGYSYRGGWYYSGIKTDDLKYLLKENGFKPKDFKAKKYGDLVEMYMKL
jgi:hypothetical protein